jgi:hypothetical protein
VSRPKYVMPCMSRNVRCRAFTRRRKYVLASGAPSARTHPTLSEFSYIGQSRGEGKPLRRWRKRRLRRERDILHASDLLAFFSCLWTLVLSTCPNAQTNLKRREGTYTEACISPPFFGARQNLRRRLPRGRKPRQRNSRFGTIRRGGNRRCRMYS